MPVPLIVQGPFPFYLHTPLPSIGCRTADRQINTGNSFLPGLSLVHGSNHLRFCVAALLTSHGLVHKTLLTDTFIAVLRCAMRFLQEAQKSRCCWNHTAVSSCSLLLSLMELPLALLVHRSRWPRVAHPQSRPYDRAWQATRPHHQQAHGQGFTAPILKRVGIATAPFAVDRNRGRMALFLVQCRKAGCCRSESRCWARYPFLVSL